MNTTILAQPIDTNIITVENAEPLITANSLTIFNREKILSRGARLGATLVFAAGILFWAHGSSTNDAWFNGEKSTGQVITWFYIGIVVLICISVGVVVCAAAADSRNSEIEPSLSEASRANRFLTNNVGLFPLADKKVEESKVEDDSYNCKV